MSPFSITCPTCGASLAIESASRIGDVELCPACRSMVLIQAPPGIAPPTSARPPAVAGDFVSEPDELTDGGSLLDSFDEGVTEAVDVTRQGAARQDRGSEKRSRFLVDDDVPPPLVDPTTYRSSRSDSTPEGIPIPPDRLPPARTPDARESRKLQHVLTLAAAMVTGVAIAAMLFAIVAVFMRPRSTPVAATDDLSSPPSLDGARDPGDPPPNDVIDPVALDPSPIEAPAVDVVPPVVDAEGDDDPAAVDPGVARPSDVVPAPTDPLIENPAPPAAPPVATPPADPPLGDAPPIFGDGAPPAAPVEGEGEGPSLAELLNRLSPGLASDPLGPDDATAAIEKQRAEELAGLRAVMSDLVNRTGDANVERKPIREVDVAARLADPIVRVRAMDLAIDDFLHQVSSLSTIPLQWDPDVRRWAAAKESARVTVRLDGTTVGGLLSEGLAPLGLGAAPREGFVEILKGEAPDDLSDVTIPWEQIPIPAAEREAFAARIRAWIDPIGWGEGEDGKQVAATEEGLFVRQTETNLFKIDLFVDRLRTAMGQPAARATPEDLLDPRPAHRRGETILSQPASLIALRPTRLDAAFNDLSSRAGLAIVVDWNSVLQSGWDPTSEATFELAEAPLRDTLGGALRKLGLGYRTIDDSTVQVLSAEAFALGVEVEIYRIDPALLVGASGKAIDPKAFVDKLVSELDAALGADFGAAEGFWLLPSDGLLVAALPRPAQVWLDRRLTPAAKTAAR